ncbi:FtsX-like permease family protein [Demequina muriae]|uniref:ABC transporter permease n=1 Tax=Demequina muriae TaxID=3051664 RepID=A0ABT8GDG3_9MICO|nr:ABC transporter permease [Demequina sp. EGI L300058]MDN4479460.1 ABC transporter permease [Demequina sp. EGI L300058]
MRQISLRALRAHWPSAAGVFLTMVLASALIFASGVLIESGLRESDPFSPTATMLPAVMGSFGGVAIMLAVFVVSSAFAASLRDRRREFALLRAVGATGRQVRSLISTEVMAISLAALVVGSVAGFFGATALVPLLRSSGIVEEGFAPVVSVWPMLGTAALLLPAAWLAGRLAAREMSSLSPTSAVSTSAADARTLSKGRITAAWVCLAGGLAATTTPIFVPGAMGGATGAASALLFTTAVALAGPALVLHGATWLAGRRLLRARAASVLATANARGYSRRLTAAVVPLALLVSLGSVQTGVNRTVAEAGAQQLGDAIAGDFVWQGSPEQAADARATLAGLPGVTAVAEMETAMVQVKVEATDEDAPFQDGLSWEAGSVLMLDDPSGLVDPKVTEGDLGALDGPDAIAVDSDGLTLTGKGVGDRIDLRHPDGSESRPTIVAVYDRGLGLGGLIVGPDGLEPSGAAESPAVIVETAANAQATVLRAADEAGLALTPVEDSVNAATEGGSSDSRLSNVLLMVLLAFIGIAAGNALVIATRSRAGEFALLGRLGATGRQMRAMLGIEAALVAVAAVALGTLTALPGLVAASLAMVRGFSLGLDPVFWAGLATAAVVIAFAGAAGARLRVRT